MAQRGDILRWGVSCAMVLVCYGAAATAILAWEPRYEPPAAPLTVALIDLAPLPDPVPPPPAPQLPPEPEVIAKPPPEVKVEVPLPPVRKPPPPKIKRDEPPPMQTPAPVETAAAPPPMPAPRMAARVDPSPNVQSLYFARIVAHVKKNLRYPRAAQTRSEQGTALVTLTIDRSGKVLAYKLNRSSSRRLLDEEAVAVIARSDPMPPIPSELGEDKMEFELPVEFNLR